MILEYMVKPKSWKLRLSCFTTLASGAYGVPASRAYYNNHAFS